MEFMELLLLLFVAYLAFKKPEKEKLAFGILVGVFVIVAFMIFAIDIQFFILPPFNL